MRARSVLQCVAIICTTNMVYAAHTWNDHQYSLTNVPGSWLETEAEAVSRDGHLVTVNSQAESDWLVATFGHQTVWIGFSQAPDSPEPSLGWRWSSNEPVTFTNWRYGQPNEHLVGDDYAIMNNNLDGGEAPWGFWDDVPLTGWPSAHYGIIEVVPDPASLSLLLFGLVVGGRRAWAPALRRP